MEDDSIGSTMADDQLDDDVDDLDPPKALGDVLESLAGAVFLDSGLSLETVWDIFHPFFKPLIGKSYTYIIVALNSAPTVSII